MFCLRKVNFPFTGRLFQLLVVSKNQINDEFHLKQMCYLINKFRVTKLLYQLLEIKSMNIQHISCTCSIIHKSVIQIVNRHDSEALQVFHQSNPISVCYVTVQASAWINATITQISPLIKNTHAETYFHICMHSQRHTQILKMRIVKLLLRMVQYVLVSRQMKIRGNAGNNIVSLRGVKWQHIE